MMKVNGNKENYLMLYVLVNKKLKIIIISINLMMMILFLNKLNYLNNIMIILINNIMVKEYLKLKLDNY